MVQISKRTPKCPEINKWMSKNVVSIDNGIFSVVVVQSVRLPCPSPSPGFCSNSCPLSQWCHPTISFSVIPFSCLQSFPASGSFPTSQVFASGSHYSTLKRKDFLGGPVVKKLPDNAADTGSIPLPGRHHIPDTRYHGATKPMHPKSLCSTTRSHRNEKPVCM